MAEPWSIYVLPCNGDPEFMEIPINEWKNRFNWKYMYNRTVMAPYVTEDREVRLMTLKTISPGWVLMRHRYLSIQSFRVCKAPSSLLASLKETARNYQ